MDQTLYTVQLYSHMLSSLCTLARVENHKNTNLDLGQADIKGAHKKKPIQCGILSKGTVSYWKVKKYVFIRMQHLKYEYFASTIY